MSNFITVYNQYKEIGINHRVVKDGHELKLVNDFIEFKKDQFRETNTNKLAIFIEPKISGTYPDVVLAKFNPYNYENYNKNRILLSNYDYKILYLLSVLGGVNCKELVSISGDSFKDVTNSLEKLFDSGLILRKRCSWRITNKSDLRLKGLETIEAKINKLDKVLEQAVLNKKITKNSYVLSNLQDKTCAQSFNKFNKMDIGLYTYNQNQYRKLRKVSNINDDVNMYSIMINEWIGKIINA